MKMKEFGSPEGRVPGTPLDTPMIGDWNWSHLPPKKTNARTTHSHIFRKVIYIPFPLKVPPLTPQGIKLSFKGALTGVAI